MRIGISGHQNLGGSKTVTWVRGEILRYLLSTGCSTGVSSLAVGADQLFAEVVLELGKVLEVVVPCEGYETTFTNASALRAYRGLLRRAATTHVLGFPGPSQDAFYKAGRFVVDRSDAMVLVWNGQTAAGRGGTGDIAKYLSERGRPFFWINPKNTKASVVH